MDNFAISPKTKTVQVLARGNREDTRQVLSASELQKRANRANQLVLIFPGRCYFLVKARGKKKTVSSTNASTKVALVLAKTPVQPANNTSVRDGSG